MRTVDVHVRWLRSKIEPDPERPVHLVTVRGARLPAGRPAALTGALTARTHGSLTAPAERWHRQQRERTPHGAPVRRPSLEESTRDHRNDQAPRRRSRSPRRCSRRRLRRRRRHDRARQRGRGNRRRRAAPEHPPTAARPVGGAVTGSINVSGSSTVEPISTGVAEALKAANPDFNYTVEGPGTGDGFKTFCEGETDITDASRKIKDEEAATCKAAGIEYVELQGRLRRHHGHDLARRTPPSTASSSPTCTP